MKYVARDTSKPVFHQADLSSLAEARQLAAAVLAAKRLGLLHQQCRDRIGVARV